MAREISTGAVSPQNIEIKRRRESTLAHVLRGWFPAHPATLAKINEWRQEGERESGVSSLLEFVENDIAISGHLITALSQRNDYWKKTISPIEDLYRLSAQELATLLPASLPEVSAHSQIRGGGILRATLESSLVTMVATELLVTDAVNRGADLSVQDVLGAALLRQIGLNLLAWNYPAVFLRIVRMLRTPKERDRAFEQCFGVTPLSLAEECAVKWRIAPRLQESLQMRADTFSKSGTIQNICELGELFGQRDYPEIFPQTEENWLGVEAQLESLLGAADVAGIRREILQHVTERLHAVGRPFSRKTARKEFDSNESDQVWKTNCGMVLSGQAGERAAALEALKNLTEQTILAAGFVRGLICLEDFEGDHFEFAISIGSDDDYSHLRNLTRAAFSARDSSIPVLESGWSLSGDSITRISSAFGGTPQKGVLVLEIDAATERDITQDGVALFKSMRTSIEQCLR